MPRDRITLPSPRYRVILGDPNNPDDEAAWVEVEVQSRNADQVGAEATFRRHKIGTVQDSPVRWGTATIYHALRRTHQIESDTGWDAFQAALIDWSVADEDAAEAPTPPAPEAG